MLSHPKHALKPRESSYTRHFVWPHSTNEVHKMQTTHAHPAQNNQNYHSTSYYSGAFLFSLVFCMAMLFFLKWCIEQHVISTGFINFIGLFFDNLTIRAAGSYSTEIALLTFTALAGFGLYALFRFYLGLAITWTIATIAALYFYTSEPETIKPANLKSALIEQGKAKKSEWIGG